MKYFVGAKMKWDFADQDDIYVIESKTQDGKYVIYVTDKFGVRYAERKEIITEKNLDNVFLSYVE